MRAGKRQRLCTLGVLLALGMGGQVIQAEPGAEIYKAKCLNCHGADGMAATPIGQALKVKPVNAPEVKSMSLAAMITEVEKGSGKMLPYKGKLSESEIRDSVLYFRSFFR